MRQLEPRMKLVERQVEVEVVPMGLSGGGAVCPYSPLGGGLLDGKYAAGQTGRLSTDQSYSKRYGQAWMHQAATELVSLAQETGIAAATLAVAWVAQNPAITAPIISARSAEQLRPSLDAIGLILNPSLRQRLSALAPPPAPATDRSDEV